jgi:hypothetical protein
MNTPIACTLSGPELKERLAIITALAERALLGHEQQGSTLHLRYAVDAAADLEEVVAAERICCAFLEFDLRPEVDVIHLAITAPAQAGEFAPVLMAHFLGQAGTSQASCTSSCGCSTP